MQLRKKCCTCLLNLREAQGIIEAGVDLFVEGQDDSFHLTRHGMTGLMPSVAVA